MKVVAVIPARYQSSRFPGKPLALIEGEPMIAWVYVGKLSRFVEYKMFLLQLMMERIEKICKEKKMQVVMTNPDHATSTERVQEVSNLIEADLYLVINGDEPLIDPKMIEKNYS